MTLKAQAQRRVLLLLGILLLGIGLVGGWMAIHITREHRRFAGYRQQGLDAAKRGDDQEAVNLLGRYLLRTPDDVEALTAYAKSRPKVPLPKGQHVAETVRTLQQLLRLDDPNRIDDYRTLMTYYQVRAMMTEANSTADDLLAKAPGDAQAMEVKIAALNQLHKYQDALNVANARLAKAPDDWYAQFGRFDAMSRLGTTRPQQLLEMAKQLQAAHPDDQGALVLVGAMYQLNNQIDEEKASLRAAAMRPTKDDHVALYLIMQLDQSGLHADAMNVLQSVVKNGEPHLQELYLRRLWEDGRLKEAADLVASSAAATMSDSESQGVYLDTLRGLGKTAEAAKVHDALALQKDDAIATAWLAFETMEASPNRDSALALRGAAQHAGNNGYMFYFQGVAAAELGDTGQAIDYWKKAAAFQYTWARPLMLAAEAELSQGHQDQAAMASAEAFQRAPGSVEAAVVQSMVWFAAIEAGDTRHMGDLTNLIDEIQKRYPGEENTSRMRVSLLGRAGETDKAIEALRAIVGKTPPPSENTLMSLAQISREWKLGMEDLCLQTMQKTYGRTPSSVLAEAMDDWRRLKDDTGLKLLEAAVSSSSGQQRVLFRLAVANYLETTGDAGATTAWVALGDQYPDDMNVQRAALTSAAAYRDRDFYDRTIDRAHKLLGDESTVWKLARAHWLLDGSDDAKTTADATALLQDVLQREPTSMGGNILMGTAKARAGDMAGATAQITAAQRLDPKSRVMALDMAKLLQYRGDYAGAAQQLDLVVSDPKSTPAQISQAAGMLAAQGEIAKAIAIMEPVADARAQPEYRLQLAALYCRANQLDKAEAIADDLDKTPSAAVILLRANIEMLKGQADKLDATLARLDGLKWQPGDLERNKGDMRFSFGQLDLALALFRSATAAAPNNVLNWMDLMECEAAMGKLADLNATAAEAGKHLPNNAQIAGIAAQSDLIAHTADGQTPRQLLAALIKDPSPKGPAVATLAMLEEVVGSNAPAAETLQKAQNLGTEYPRFLPAQILLAEVQLRLGRCADAVQSANRAAENFPTEARPAELATIAMSSNGQWDDALQMARTWKGRMLGDSTRADLQIAQIQVRLGDPAGALATVQPLLSAGHLTADQQWQALLLEAMAMVRQGKPGDAAAALWPMVKSTPKVTQVFLGFVASNLPPEAAEPWLNQVNDLLKTEADSEQAQLALATTWDLLAARSGNKKYEQLALDIVQRLEQVPSVSGQAALTAGILADQNGDAKTAEAAYRRAIAKANLPEARNNLAMIVANSGDINEAVELARQCVKGAPYQAAYYDTLAYILAKAGKYDEAVGAMSTAMHLEPDNAKWHVNLAKILLAAGKFNQAKQQIAELDLMTPGVASLKDFPNYLKDLDAVRKQLDAGPGIAR